MHLLPTSLLTKSVIFKIYQYTFNGHGAAQHEPHSPLNTAEDLSEGLNFTINFPKMQQKSVRKKSGLWVNRLVKRLEFGRLEPSDWSFSADNSLFYEDS